MLTEKQEGTGFWFAEVTLHGQILGRGFSSDRALAVSKAIYDFRGRRKPVPLSQIGRSCWR